MYLSVSIQKYLCRLASAPEGYTSPHLLVEMLSKPGLCGRTREWAKLGEDLCLGY